MKKILIVAAHPDDEILGCGGTIIKLLNEGRRCKIIFLAEGSSARFDIKTDQDKIAEDIKQRTLSAIKAMNIIGCDNYKFYNLPCGRLDSIPLIELGKFIEKEIKHFQPDTIFTHSFVDVNNDHRLVFQAVLQATRPNALNFVKKVYSFEILTSTEWRFHEAFKPNFFIQLSEQQLQQKILALNAYQSEVHEFPYPRSEEGLKTQAQYRGMQIGCNYAEAFTLIREIL